MSQADEWVSAEFQRLAEIIQDYDPYLFLEWIPPEGQIHLADKSKVFRVVDDRKKTIVLYASSLANPTEILEALWTADCKNGDPIAKMDAHNAAVEALKLKAKIDESEGIKDFTAFVAKNTKSRWRHEGRIRDDEFQDLGPVRSVIDK
jgi:hypothetical protein